jgi:hypothetical protein
MAAPKPKAKEISDLDHATFDAALSSSITDETLLVTFIRSCNMMGISQEDLSARKSKITSKSKELQALPRPQRRVQLFKLLLGILEQ